MKTYLAGAALAVVTATGAFAEGVTHYVAFHVSQNDPQVMNMALNNVMNITAFYEGQGDTVVAELVAYGPGLNMFIPGRSPVEDRLSLMSLELENLTLSACGNTLRNMSASAGHDIDLIAEAQITPSGVVRLIELQEQNYAYVRP